MRYTSEFILNYSVPKALDLPCSVISWFLWFSHSQALGSRQDFEQTGLWESMALPPSWTYCNLQRTHSPDPAAPDVSPRSGNESFPLSKAVAVSRQDGEARDRDTLRDGSGDGKQIEEGLGENQGPAVAGRMWETRGEAVVSGDCKMHGWVAGQLGVFVKMENRKEEEQGQRSRAQFRCHRVSTAGETALWKTQ